MAECHPVGFQWVMEAKRRGATVIHVDPRFTRTSAVADVHVPIRAGTDIVFLGALVRHVIDNDLWFQEYVRHYTNAAALVVDGYRDTEDLDGLFSGWDADAGRYDQATWQFDGTTDPSLEHPRCVFQIVRRHFARYTPAMVEEVCGVPEALFARVADAIGANSGRDRTTAFCYAVGWTQHTSGAQVIRTAAILQLLLGNIGRPGGGILALRGHATIQGSTDVPTLFNLLPGYLPMPRADQRTIDVYVAEATQPTGGWAALPAYLVSLLRAWFGAAATADNGWGFDWLPHLTGDHSHMATVADMADGRVRGYFVMGENPVVGSMHGGLQRAALAKLDWLVVRDFTLIETAEFWRGPGCAPEDVGTEVFFFPAAAHTEKDGTYTNTQRLLQFRHKALDPPGECRSELWFLYHLGRRLRALYAGSELERDRPIHALTWDYPTVGPHDEPDVEAVLREINGYRIDDGSVVSGFGELRADGTTACGCWIYSGVMAGGRNQAARRRPASEQHWVAPEWGWAWPANRRLLYNRASADPDGRPWSSRKAYVWWDEAAGRWGGHDVPDVPFPDQRAGAGPFIMKPDGLGWLFVPTGLADGPLPAHYEPRESVVENPLYGQQVNPATVEFVRAGNPYHRAAGDPRFPFVLTTYRLTEHHTAGGMSRWLRWLAELQPALFCEVSPELAAERGLTNGGWATITTARAEVEARVLVTRRIPPVRVRRRLVHQIGMPYHWGERGLVTGDVTNDLIAFVADPNVWIQESKALTANIRPGRRARG